MFLLILLNISCSYKDDREDGDWDDHIKLSEKEVQFDSLENSVTINTEGSGWWISGIFFKEGETFDFSTVDTTSKSFTITESDFIVERLNEKELFIKLFENTTGSERIFTVGLQAGNYFDGITITQSAD